MTNERRNEDRDRLVRDTYKALAKERVPDRLNDQVMQQAVRAGRSRYSRTRAWTRPVAWAATVGLSLAIVLELTRLPETEPDALQISAPDRQMPEKQRVPADTAAPLPAQGVPLESVLDAERSRPETRATKRPRGVSMDEFAPKDMNVLRDAENMARVQAGANQTPAAARGDADAVSAEEIMTDEKSAVASFAVISEKKELESKYACPEESRNSAESWFACIEQLRAHGPAARAASEYDEFRRIFPDFVAPTADK